MEAFFYPSVGVAIDVRAAIGVLTRVQRCVHRGRVHFLGSERTELPPCFGRDHPKDGRAHHR